MKSQLPDQAVKISCKTCQCAIYNGNTQTGCSFDRIKIFGDNTAIEAYDDEKEFYVLKRFCNYYRNPKWNGGVLNLEKIKHESASSFDVIISCDNLTEELDVENLIHYVSSAKYYPDKLNISLVHSSSVSTNIRKNILKAYMTIKCNLTDTIELNEFIHNFLESSKSTYHTVLDISNISVISKLHRANDSINNDLKISTVFHIDSAKIISNMVYRLECGLSGETNYSTNISRIISQSIASQTYLDLS
jgi:hypothetical protein